MASTIEKPQRHYIDPAQNDRHQAVTYPAEDDTRQQVVEQFIDKFGEQILGKVKQSLPRPNQAKDVQRQVDAMESADDRLVFFVLTATVAIAVAWATVAATMKFGPNDFFYKAAGGFIGGSFLAGWLYIKCRGWRNFAHLFSTAIPLVRPSAVMVDAIHEAANAPTPNAIELVDELSQHIDEHNKLVSAWAETFSFAQRALLVAAVGFFLAWLAVK